MRTKAGAALAEHLRPTEANPGPGGATPLRVAGGVQAARSAQVLFRSVCGSLSPRNYRGEGRPCRCF